MTGELFDAIESPRFSAWVNAASGFHQFVRAVASSPDVGRLLAEVRSTEDVQEIFLRIAGLALAPYDRRYENPNDAPLSAYLWVLGASEPEFALAAAEMVRECEGCWWATRLAEKLLARRRRKAESSRVTRVIPCEPGLGTPSSHAADHSVVYAFLPPGAGEAIKQSFGRVGRSPSLGLHIGGGEPRNRNRGARNYRNRPVFEAAS